jgi:hypothetical protein
MQSLNPWRPGIVIIDHAPNQAHTLLLMPTHFIQKAGLVIKNLAHCKSLHIQVWYGFCTELLLTFERVDNWISKFHRPSLHRQNHIKSTSQCPPAAQGPDTPDNSCEVRRASETNTWVWDFIRVRGMLARSWPDTRCPHRRSLHYSNLEASCRYQNTLRPLSLWN